MATVKLQGIYGKQKAIPAAELKPGMITVWNFCYTETVKVLSLRRVGKALNALSFPTIGRKEYTRTMRNDRLVAIA